MEPREESFFREYLVSRRVLIADPSAAARSGLFRVFQDMGAKTSQIVLANSFHTATQEISSSAPNVVVAEYEFGRRCGLELLQSQRQLKPEDTKDAVFMVVTSNTSQSAVARAAEEDIDAYVLKPFTVDHIRTTIARAALEKIKPSAYLKAIEEGKKALYAGEHAAAEHCFIEALSLDPSPALACYYLGQAKYVQKVMQEAEGSYRRGLELNRIHYKCMVGLYELLMEQQNFTGAYEIVKRISQYFPANPRRMVEVLRLAIMTTQYDDVEKYYDIFKNIDDREEILVKSICAALVVCGRYQLRTKNRVRALDLFQKAAATGAGRSVVLREIVHALVDFELGFDAETFLGRYPPGEQSSADYQRLVFEVQNSQGNVSKAIDLGRSLIAKGIGDERTYRMMLERSIEAGLKASADTILREAMTRFPSKMAEFARIAGVRGYGKN